MSRRVLVCGGRDFGEDRGWFGTQERVLLTHVLDAHNREDHFSCLIHGAAKGADSHAARWAKERNIPTEAYPADWETHGKAAGPIRNRRMLVEGKPDVVIAFRGGRGTADMCRQARAAGVEVIEVAS